jgi:AraC family transcriptional regulator
MRAGPMQDPDSPAQLGILATTIGQRFHRPPVPSAIVCLGSKDPIVFSHVASDVAMPAPTLLAPVEEAFSIHVHHMPLSRGEIWLEGSRRAMPLVPEGGIFVWDLRMKNSAQVYQPFEFSRFQVSKATMNDLAYEHGMRRLGDLRAPGGEPDPVVRHLALAMLQRAAFFGQERETLFADGIALAFFAHVAQKYAGAVEVPGLDGVLAPWQIRRVTDWVSAHMNGPVAIADLAGLVNLSRSHFTRMFQRTLGISPHRWLLLRRIERAKSLLKGSIPLADVAAVCGFVDQSHFTKVFTRIEGVPPGAWRRTVH